MKTTAGVLVALLLTAGCAGVARTANTPPPLDQFLREFRAERGFPMRSEQLANLCVKSGLNWASSSNDGQAPYPQYSCTDPSSALWIDVTDSSEGIVEIEAGLRSIDADEVREAGREWKQVLGIKAAFGVPEVVSHTGGGQSWVLVDVYEVPGHYWVARMTIGDPLNPPVSTHRRVR